MYRFRSFCLVLFFWFTLANVYGQCAMCKAAVESVEDEGGYNDAILYLMMFPYLIGLVALFFFLYNRKKLRSED